MKRASRLCIVVSFVMLSSTVCGEIPTPTPQPGALQAIWQYTGWPALGAGDPSDDVDLLPKGQSPARVFWYRHLGDHYGWVIRRAEGEQSSVFLPITPTPVCVNAEGTPITPGHSPFFSERIEER